MIQDYRELVTNTLNNETAFIKGTFTCSKNNTKNWIKVIVRPVLIKLRRYLQFSYFDKQKDLTKNYYGKDAQVQIQLLLDLKLKNIALQSLDEQIQIQLDKRGQVKIKSVKNQQPVVVNLVHDQEKKLILSTNKPDAYLKAVGIMTEDGKIKTTMQDKFKQVNEFLRLIDETETVHQLDTPRLSVVDLGCGNAYLTFATYHYFNSILNIPTRLTGVDTKSDLLEKHALKAKNLGWEGISFETGQIINFEPKEKPDVVLALHACDTATDEALMKGITWQSKLIFSAPCCQHELQTQLQKQLLPDQFKIVLRHGILKERLGDILTDAFRATILRILGYQTDVVQFVSSDHTAKNLMIRAVKTLPPGDPKFIQEYQALKQFWGVTPYLETLLGKELRQYLM